MKGSPVSALFKFCFDAVLTPVYFHSYVDVSVVSFPCFLFTAAAHTTHTNRSEWLNRPFLSSPQAYFSFLDRDGSGRVTADEFSVAVRLLDPKLDSTVKLDELFALLDTNGDGKVGHIEAFEVLRRSLEVACSLAHVGLAALGELLHGETAQVAAFQAWLCECHMY